LRRASSRTRRPTRARGATRRVDTRRRLLLLLAVLVGLFAVVIWKVADLQVLNPGHYLAVSTSQAVHSETLAAERGSILDRNHAELAMSIPEKTVFADPKLVTDPAGEAARLAPVLGLDAADLTVKLAAHNRFDYLARKIAPSVAAKVAAMKLPGIDFLDEPTVVMPGGATSTALLGAVDVDNKGLSGLEAQYDRQLTGRPGELTLAENPQGRTIPVGEHQLVPAVEGEDLVLSVDQSMQYETEQVLAQAVDSAHAKGGTAIVSNPSTGEILAMANVDLDPTTKLAVPSTNNAALTTVYEPGSVMKIATIAAALERGLITPTTKIDVPGSYRVADGVFTDAEQHATEQMTVADIVAQSSNIGTIKIAQGLGVNGVYQGVTQLGYGRTTALHFPNEAAGYLAKPSDWSGTSIATIPIGQGVSVTALQVLESYNTVANGGRYVAPKLIDATIDSNGHSHPTPTDPGHRVMSTAVANQMNLMLRGVVTGGTGTLAAVDGYTVFGKTGTAREPQPNGRYTDAAGRYHYDSTFVGVVPAQSPSLSVIVVIDDPSGANYFGGSVAAPAFSKIASYALRLFHIPPPSNDVASGGAPIPGGGGGVGGVVVTEPNGKIRGAVAGTPTTTLKPPSPSPSVPTTTTAHATATATARRTGAPSTGPPASASG
jgi:cell division protein FtsI (penicillin-binding protein 3)